LNGLAWVGSSTNLDAAKNGSWFRLGHGNHPDAALQAEWNQHGAERFSFEVVELLDDDVASLSLKDILAQKKAAWVERLSAAALFW
jgi:hypothetical protein